MAESLVLIIFTAEQMSSSRILYSSLFFLLPLLVRAQQYLPDHNTRVFNGTHELAYPFAGGLNNPQFSQVDLNGDGIQDLYIFDRTGNKSITFLNTGSPGVIDLTYWPEYSARFPAMQDWAILYDYNCDGIEDIVCGYDQGIRLYKALWDGDGLHYVLDVDKLQYSEAGFNFDLAVGYIDIPGIGDVDMDGDVDVLTFNFATGGTVDYFQNKQVENGLPCGTWDMEHVESCWGNFYESGLHKTLDLDFACKGVTHKDGLHAGSTFMLFDEENDGDMDVVLGDLAFGNLTRIINGGDAMTAHITEQDTTFPSYSVPYEKPLFPAAFYIDIDNDGKKDMLVSPNNRNFSENHINVSYYKDISTDDTVEFQYKTDTLIVSDMLDFGEGAFPVFFDYDYDGLQDLIIGNTGYYDGGANTSQIALYRNTGTATLPQYSLVNSDFGGLSAFGFHNIAPTFFDGDGDGDADMLIGTEEGFVQYFKNIGPPGGPAQFILFGANYQGIDPGQNAAPQAIDVNGDALPDLIIGEKNGNLNYYENMGTASAPDFQLQDEFWGNVDVRAVGDLTGYSVPFLVHNGDGSNTLYVGCQAGTIYQYDPGATFTAPFTKLTATFNELDEGSYTSVCFADINNDGFAEMITGNARGGVSLYHDINGVNT
ncbi:MAG: hypothetical protein R2794_04070, partial [Chitinophagales bacterium]